ncbi:MAG TPA: hypothetical protein VLT36_10310 [Candidatus Dormibacteraeota bacterium]|nr:hypothetical protein [Candidatus Dormibacteraeota bacterium]
MKIESAAGPEIKTETLSTPPSGGPERGPLSFAAFERYVPLAVWALVVLTFLCIAFRIFSYGYLPAGDARRHIAKAMTERTYPEILVLRPGYFMTNSPGWEWLLRQLHRTAGWSQDALASFAIISLLLWVFFSPLPWLRRPEAWAAALLAEMLVLPELMPNRLTQARPFLLTEGILIGILLAWSRTDLKPPAWSKIVLTWLAFSLCVWVHGLWYLWVLPLAAFCLGGQWKSALWLTGCWMAGTLTGALLTGHPVAFLTQALFIASSISHQAGLLQQWMLVGELRPNFGNFTTLALLAIVFLLRRAVPGSATRFSGRPALWLIGLSWVLGLKADRFWADWGLPAVFVWLTIQFEEMSQGFWSSGSLKRVAFCGFVALALFLDASNDPDERYSFNQRESLLDAADPALQGWLPEPGGIFYCSEMRFFYTTFYKNPDAPWRYVLGLEPALMPDEDLKILRFIQFNHGTAKAYEPWVQKMRPEDRLVIYGTSQPTLPQLQWLNPAGDTWIGRLPLSATP